MGRIVSVHSGSSGDRAVVEVDAIVDCARCAEGKGCGAGVFGQSKRGKVLEAIVSPQLTVRAGDLVDVALEPSSLLRAASLVYGLPLLLSVAFAGTGWWFGVSDAGAVALALLGLIIGILNARRKLRTDSCLRDFTPTVVRHHE